MHEERLKRFRELLNTATREELCVECAALFSAGVDHKEVVRVILSKVSSASVADPSWLPAASVINLSDSLVHMPLQANADRHRVMAFGERHPPFRRIESPPRVDGNLEQLRTRFDQATLGNDWQLAERCLIGIAAETDVETVLRVVLTCLLQPRYLGKTSGPWWAGVRHLSIGCMIDLWQEYGDDAVREVACFLGSRQAAKVGDEPDGKTAKAIAKLESAYRSLDEPFGDPVRDGTFDEDEFRNRVSSGDVESAFAAVTDAWRAGIAATDVDLSLTMLCIERLLRGAYGDGANWDNHKRELQATGVIRRAVIIDNQLAYKAALHAVWQIVRHGDDGLCEKHDIPELKLHPLPDEDEQIGYVINGIGASSSEEAIAQAGNFVAGGHSVERLMAKSILLVREKCCGSGYYAGQRGMIDAWNFAKDHPQRNRIPLALAGWMANYRNQHFKHQKRYGPIWGANLSDDGGLLAIRSGGTRIFDAKSGDELMFFRGEPWRFAFHPHGRLLAAGWDGGDLQIIDLLARKVVKQWPAFPDDVSGQFGEGKFWGLAFNSDGTLLAGCSRGCNEVHVWDTATWELKFELFGHSNNRIESVTFSPDGQTLASGGNDGTVRLWDMKTGEPLLVFDRHDDDTGRISGLQFHPDGQRVISAQCNGEVKVWDSRTGEEHFTAWPARDLNFAGFTPDGKLAISEHGGTLHYHDAASGEAVAVVAAINNKENDHTIFGGANQSRDRSTIVTAGWHGQIRIWNATSRELVCSLDLKVE